MSTLPDTVIRVGKEEPTRLTSYRTETLAKGRVRLTFRASGRKVAITMRKHELERLYETMAVAWGS